MDTLFWLAVATVVIVLFFDYTNGFHDAANIVATIIASRAMTPAQAVVVVGEPLAKRPLHDLLRRSIRPRGAVCLVREVSVPELLT